MIIRNHPITTCSSLVVAHASQRGSCSLVVAHASQRGNRAMLCCLCHAMKRDLLLCHSATPTLGSVGYYSRPTIGHMRIIT